MPRESHKSKTIAKLPVLDRQNRRYLEALIPADRADELGAYEWQLHRHLRTKFMSVQAKVGKRILFLHRLVARAQPYHPLSLRDGDPLNCLPENLVHYPPATRGHPAPEGYGQVPDVMHRAVIEGNIARLPVLDRENRRYVEALVPADRAEELDTYEWLLRPHKKSGIEVVQAWVGPNPIYLHRLVARPGRSQSVSFRDGNPLNCLPSNLVVEEQLGARSIPEERCCKLCGKPLPPSTSPRKRRHCSNRCKQRQNYLRRCERLRAQRNT